MGAEYHAPNHGKPEGDAWKSPALKPKKFYAVCAKERDENGKLVRVSGTFDNQDMALAAAQRAVDALFDVVEVFEGEVEWKPYEPTTKGTREKWEKICNG